MTVLELATRWAESPRILVVEPDAEAAKTVAAALRRYACKIVSATDLATALDALDDEPYSLVLVSIDFPKCGELVRALQKALPLTPVMVATLGTERWLIELLENDVAALRPAPLQRTLRNTFAALSLTTTA